MQFPHFVVLVVWTVITEFLNPHFHLLITIKKEHRISNSVHSNLVDGRVNFLAQHQCYNYISLTVVSDFHLSLFLASSGKRVDKKEGGNKALTDGTQRLTPAELSRTCGF